jgi:hypothetical protein
MIPFSIIFDEPAWPELANKAAVAEGRIEGLAVLDNGTASGRPSVALRIETKYGQTVIAETTARLFCTAAKAVMAKYPDLFED